MNTYVEHTLTQQRLNELVTKQTLNKLLTKQTLNELHLSNKKYCKSNTDNTTIHSDSEAAWHLPSDKEWINSTYAYNKNTLKPLVAAEVITNELIKNYFNLEILNNNKKSTRTKTRFRRLSLNKILASKTEIKHLNNRNIITVYAYNRNSKHTHYKIRKSYFPSFLRSATAVKSKSRTNTNMGSFTFKYNSVKKRTGASRIGIGKKKNTIVKIKLNNTNKTSLVKSSAFMKTGLKKKSKKLFKKFRLNSSSRAKIYADASVKTRANEAILFSKYNKLNYNTQKAHKKYLLVKRFLMWKNLKKASLMNWRTAEFANIIRENQYLVTFYILKLISLKTVMKIVSIIRRIIRSYRLIRNQKTYLIETIKQNLIKRYYKPGISSKFIFITPKEHNSNFLFPESHIVEKYNIINTINLYTKKMIYLYYLQRLSVNNAKFKNWFIVGLNSVLSKVFNKKINLNIVNLKYLYLNSDNYVVSIATKLKNRKNRLLRVLKKATQIVSIPFSHTYSNQHTTPSINPVHDSKPNIEDFVLSAVKYKWVNGVRIKAAGRLSKRLTASRSVSKLKYKGSTRDVEISRNKASSRVLVGYKKPNVQYANVKSKTLIGSFGLKALVSSTSSVYTPLPQLY